MQCHVCLLFIFIGSRMSSGGFASVRFFLKINIFKFENIDIANIRIFNLTIFCFVHSMQADLLCRPKDLCLLAECQVRPGTFMAEDEDEFMLPDLQLTMSHDIVLTSTPIEPCPRPALTSWLRKCTQCRKSYKWPSGLSRHMLIHNQRNKNKLVRRKILYRSLSQFVVNYGQKEHLKSTVRPPNTYATNGIILYYSPLEQYAYLSTICRQSCPRICLLLTIRIVSSRCCQI